MFPRRLYGTLSSSGPLPTSIHCVAQPPSEPEPLRACSQILVRRLPTNLPPSPKIETIMFCWRIFHKTIYCRSLGLVRPYGPKIGTRPECLGTNRVTKIQRLDAVSNRILTLYPSRKESTLLYVSYNSIIPLRIAYIFNRINRQALSSVSIFPTQQSVRICVERRPMVKYCVLTSMDAKFLISFKSTTHCRQTLG